MWLSTHKDGLDIPLNLDGDGEIRRKLEEVGAKITPLVDNPKVVHVTAASQEALGKLQQIVDKQIPAKKVPVEITGDKELFTRLLGLGPAPVKVPGDALGPAGPLIVPGRATGGRLPTTGPGTATTDGIVAVNRQGVPQALVDGGEWLIERHRSAEYDTELGMINAGTFPKLPGLATGGRIPAEQALDVLRGESGKPYQYGGTGNPSWDCSGFISAAYALLKGLDWHTRWFTTESDFGSLGFAAGLDSTGQGLSIGVHNGGGGQYSHMAGKLASVPIESGPNGVRVGAGAASPGDSQFESRYHLVEVISGGRSRTRSARSKPWAEKDELALQSAETSVEQAKLARDRALKDPHKSAQDKKQADLRVQRAEQRVRDLQAKKQRGTSDEAPAPPAPGLDSALTDDEISLRDLQRAIDDADDKRDEVYADPKATAADRAKADDDLQKAMNALVAAQKKQAGGEAANPVELIGNAVKSAVTGQLEDALGVFGLDSSLGATGALITAIANGAQKNQKNPSRPSFGRDELAKQGPVTPGTPNWIEELQKTLVIPAFLRDSGGPLPHGAAALNLSGATEWVLNSDQMRGVASGMAAMRAPAPAGNIHAGISIGEVHTGMSRREFDAAIQELQVDQRQRVRSFVPR